MRRIERTAVRMSGKAQNICISFLNLISVFIFIFVFYSHSSFNLFHPLLHNILFQFSQFSVFFIILYFHLLISVLIYSIHSFLSLSLSPILALSHSLSLSVSVSLSLSVFLILSLRLSLSSPLFFFISLSDSLPFILFFSFWSSISSSYLQSIVVAAQVRYSQSCCLKLDAFFPMLHSNTSKLKNIQKW